MTNVTTMDIMEKLEKDETNLNQFFLLIMGALILFMQCGFAFLEAGAVRSKNVVNILIKNALDCFCGAVIYWAVGYGFAYGVTETPVNQFIGNKYFFSIYLPETEYAFWFFQFVFAATAATIVSGAVAERTQFGAYIIYSSFITGFVYPVVSHWGWSNGWLTDAKKSGLSNFDDISFVDFAGSGIVHCCGGIAALMGAVFIGPRIGKFSADGSKTYVIPGHSVPIAALGGFILFLGFLAFNGGSQLTIVGGENDGAIVARAFMNTMLGGAGGAISAIVSNVVSALIKKEQPYWSLLTCINGGLGGMVALCAGCNAFHQGAAFGVGIIGGFTMWWVSGVVIKLGVDDPLDAFAVHYGGGVCGVLLTPLFMFDGVVYWQRCADQEGYNDPNFVCDYTPFKIFAWNLIGLIAITVWTGGITGTMFFGLNKLNLLRVDKDIEIRGLDIRKHGEPAYPTAAYGHGWDNEGDFDMSNLKDGRGGNDGRRTTRTLADPNNPDAWNHAVSKDGLIAMAVGYQQKHYKAPVENGKAVAAENAPALLSENVPAVVAENVPALVTENLPPFMTEQH